jgi:hypothetical protein
MAMNFLKVDSVVAVRYTFFCEIIACRHEHLAPMVHRFQKSLTVSKDQCPFGAVHLHDIGIPHLRRYRHFPLYTMDQTKRPSEIFDLAAHWLVCSIHDNSICLRSAAFFIRLQTFFYHLVAECISYAGST